MMRMVSQNNLMSSVPGTHFARPHIMSHMMAVILVVVLLVPLFSLTGCNRQNKPQRLQAEWTGSFDTVIQLIAYTDSEKTFRRFVEQAQDQFSRMHQLFDIYHDYPGMNNLKTINDQAGLEPVPVDQEIIDLLLFIQTHAERSGFAVDMTLGPVLEIWHEYRDEALTDPSLAEVPAVELLAAAASLRDPSGVEIDPENRTVRLSHEGMSLDVGAIAKGYATERVAEALRQSGLKSGIISAGGSNVRLIGKPDDPERDTWNIGIQDPDDTLMLPSLPVLDTIEATETSIVTSGDYQRYYTVGDTVYHHLIDPDTLMPARHFRVVTIMIPDSGIADFLSSALFILPYEEGLALLKQYPGAEALWVFHDGTMKATAGMRQVLRDKSAEPAE